MAVLLDTEIKRYRNMTLCTFDSLISLMMMMILLVWQPIGWISYKVQCKLQKKEK